VPAMTAFLWRAAPPTATPPTRTSAGGGLGLLGPQFGLGCDQVLSLTMVDAQGSLVTASKTQNPRLLAASCGGGGGNFGANTGVALAPAAAAGRGWDPAAAGRLLYCGSAPHCALLTWRLLAACCAACRHRG
jgi:hypothetical protein